jgi:hypothetical protein
MSPPHTTPPPQNPPKAPKKQDATHTTHPSPKKNPPKVPNKQDANVDEPNTNPKTTVVKFLGGLKNYKHKKLLEDLAILGMTVKEFWHHGNKDYMDFEYGKPLVPKHVHVKFPFIMQKFDE